jgi:hypothetical protein
MFKRYTMKAMTLAVLVVLTIGVPVAAQISSNDEVLTNEKIIGMTTANVEKDLLLSKLTTTRNAFDVSVGGLVTLNQGKVNQDVMKAMITAAANPKLGPLPLPTPEVLDNQSVITMVTGKVPKAVVLMKIQNSRGLYDMSSAGLVSLTQAKVPSDVIQVMTAKNGEGK